MGPVTYEVYHPDKGKERQTYNVNLLKEWKERASEEAKPVLMVRKVEVEDEDCEVQVQRQTLPLDFTHLQDAERSDLQHLSQFPQLVRQSPGRTDIAQHTIHLNDPMPLRQRLYRIPEHLLTPLKKEIEMMIQLGVIEPSISEWSSPLVIVPKKDNSLRICIDFHKLNSLSLTHIRCAEWRNCWKGLAELSSSLLSIFVKVTGKCLLTQHLNPTLPLRLPLDYSISLSYPSGCMERLQRSRG